MRPIAIPNCIYEVAHSRLDANEQVAFIKKRYPFIRKEGVPDVTIVIPAYNEEKNILSTLQSLVQTNTTKRMQIIVVNNNSRDRTEELVKMAGVECIMERNQGITEARNAGLAAALGHYILNADADAIYPPHWIDLMIDPLIKKYVALTYGRFSFLPTGSTGRAIYFLYEHAADLLRSYNKHFKEEAVNVYGFNSAFKRTDGLKMQGFNHPAGTNEDGYLALKLRDAGFGKLHYVTDAKALVWTTDRRLQIEGGFIKGLMIRFKKYLFPGSFVQVRTDL